MKKEITVGQLLSVAVTLLITIVTGWVTLNRQVSTHEAEIQALQQRADKSERILERIEGKVELILINLEKKKNR